MLDMVAESAEGYETREALNMGVVIILPDLMAIETTRRISADTAFVVVLSVDASPELIPGRSANFAAHAVKP